MVEQVPITVMGPLGKCLNDEYSEEEWNDFCKNYDFHKLTSLLSGEILPQRKLPMTITLRNISSEVGLIKYIFDVASFEEDLTNRV